MINKNGVAKPFKQTCPAQGFTAGALPKSQKSRKKLKINKMKTLKTLFVILIAGIFSSCATHMGMMQGSASLSTNNFKVIKLASGTSQTTKIFGFGGLGKDALVLEAKKSMLQNNPLKDGQALANVTVDFKNSYLLIVMTQKVTVTADIVEFKQ